MRLLLSLITLCAALWLWFIPIGSWRRAVITGSVLTLTVLRFVAAPASTLLACSAGVWTVLTAWETLEYLTISRESGRKPRSYWDGYSDGWTSLYDTLKRHLDRDES